MNKLSLILQHEPTDCGLACLAMILNYYGSKTDVSALQHIFPTAPRGTSLAGLVKMAHACHLTSKVYYLSLQQLATLSSPCILYWDNNHYVILGGKSKDKWRIFDPAYGYQECSSASVAEHFSGLVLTLTPSAHYKPLVSQHRITYWQFIKLFFARLSHKTYLTLIFLSLVTQALLLLYPYGLQQLFSSRWAVSTIMVLTLCFIKVAEAVFYFWRGQLAAKIEGILHQQFGLFIINRLFAMPHTFFMHRTAPHILQRLGYLEKMRDMLSRGLAEGIIDGVLSFSILILLLLQEPLFACWVVVCSLLYILIHQRIYAQTQMIQQMQANIKAREQCHLLETIRGYFSLRVIDKIPFRVQQWSQYATEGFTLSSRISSLQTSLDTVRILLFGMLQVGILLYCNASLILYLFIYMRTLAQFTNKYCDLLQIRQPLSQLSTLMSNQMVSSRGSGELSRCLSAASSLLLDNLSFTYNVTPLFKNLNLALASGQCLLIQGTSGAGKSTLMKVMLGILPPTTGAVHFPPAQVSAAVFQEDVLFSGTILQNIALSAQPDEERVTASAKLAAIDHVIVALPMGYHTHVTQEAWHMSGGQKQRLLLARAFYQNPDIIFMDEACSQLDVDTELAIYSALKEQGVTTVIISHRPQVASLADQLLVI